MASHRTSSSGRLASQTIQASASASRSSLRFPILVLDASIQASLLARLADPRLAEPGCCLPWIPTPNPRALLGTRPRPSLPSTALPFGRRHSIIESPLLSPPAATSWPQPVPKSPRTYHTPRVSGRAPTLHGGGPTVDPSVSDVCGAVCRARVCIELCACCSQPRYQERGLHLGSGVRTCRAGPPEQGRREDVRTPRIARIAGCVLTLVLGGRVSRVGAHSLLLARLWQYTRGSLRLRTVRSRHSRGDRSGPVRRARES